MNDVFIKHLKKKKVLSSCTRSVVAIGNFDGLHLGHQQIIEKTLEIAGIKFSGLMLQILKEFINLVTCFVTYGVSTIIFLVDMRKNNSVKL